MPHASTAEHTCIEHAFYAFTAVLMMPTYLIHIYTHIHTYTQIHIRTHTFTYIHTNIYIRVHSALVQLYS